MPAAAAECADPRSDSRGRERSPTFKADMSWLLNARTREATRVREKGRPPSRPTFHGCLMFRHACSGTPVPNGRRHRATTRQGAPARPFWPHKGRALFRQRAPARPFWPHKSKAAQTLVRPLLAAPSVRPLLAAQGSHPGRRRLICPGSYEPHKSRPLQAP